MGGAGGNPAKPTLTTRPDYAFQTSAHDAEQKSRRLDECELALATAIAPALAFNLGVEFGQLAIVVTALSVLYVLDRVTGAAGRDPGDREMARQSSPSMDDIT